MTGSRKKRVFLCEGLHEQLFMSHLLDSRNFSHCVVQWNDLMESRIHSAEEVCIRKFLASKRPYTGIFLLKNEEGKERCIDTFIELISSVPTQYQILMLLDSQGISVLEDIRYRVKETIGRDILNVRNSFWYPTKNPSGHHILLIPNTLEKMMIEVIGHSPEHKSNPKRIKFFTEFLLLCQGDGDEVHKILYRSILSAIEE